MLRSAYYSCGRLANIATTARQHSQEFPTGRINAEHGEGGVREMLRGKVSDCDRSMGRRPVWVGPIWGVDSRLPSEVRSQRNP